MIQYKNQYYLLLAACLGFVVTSAPAQAQSQEQQLDTYSFGSGGAGWDSTSGQNPFSDTSNQSAYSANSGAGMQHPGMAVNRDPNSVYTANGPGMPATSAQSTGAIVPAVTSSGYLPPQFSGSTPLPNTSQRLLTPTNTKLGLGLPPTTLDSFVRDSGMSDAIYGDEGGLFPPGATNFSYISHGFDKKTREGLTTGHGSKLPSAWGGDEFHGNEHSVSGPNYASNPLNVLAPALNVPTR